MVQRPHFGRRIEFLADLNHAGNLVCLAFTHEVGHGGGEHENLQRRTTAFLVHAFEKILCDDAAQ